MKVETISKAIIAALLAAELASCTKAALMQNRITDLETQRDIYKSMYEDWKGAAGEVAGYADTLRDSLKARDRLDGKLLVEDAQLDRNERLNETNQAPNQELSKPVVKLPP